MADLLALLSNPAENFGEIKAYFRDDVLPVAIERLNREFAARRLSKLNRDIEPLRIEQRQLSSYRTRLGTMLEYGLSTEIDRILYDRYHGELILTFAVAHEFPDFYLRDKRRNQLLKIEMKAVDAASDEQAARFDVLTKHLNPYRDFLLFVAWKWENYHQNDGAWEAPRIFTSAFVSAYDIASIRDIRLAACGGKIVDGRVLVPSAKLPGTFVNDQGNFGKLWRIIPSRQRNDGNNFNNDADDFLRFLSEVDSYAPKKRMK